MQVDQVGESTVKDSDQSQNLLSQISLEQASLHIGTLLTEKGKLTEDLRQERERLEETKVRIERLDALEVKSKNLENANAHLVSMLNQKDEALKNQLAYLEEFKAKLKQKEDMDSAQKGDDEAKPSNAELSAKIASLERIQKLLEQKSKLQATNNTQKETQIATF